MPHLRPLSSTKTHEQKIMQNFGAQLEALPHCWDPDTGNRVSDEKKQEEGYDTLEWAPRRHTHGERYTHDVGGPPESPQNV